jgi:hypothetical protein
MNMTETQKREVQRAMQAKWDAVQAMLIEVDHGIDNLGDRDHNDWSTVADLNRVLKDLSDITEYLPR